MAILLMQKSPEGCTKLAPFNDFTHNFFLRHTIDNFDENTEQNRCLPIYIVSYCVLRLFIRILS